MYVKSTIATCISRCTYNAILTRILHDNFDYVNNNDIYKINEFAQNGSTTDSINLEYIYWVCI